VQLLQVLLALIDEVLTLITLLSLVAAVQVEAMVLLAETAAEVQVACVAQ
jgi:hypothetical protein